MYLTRFALVIVLAFSGATLAQSQTLPSATVDALEDFYHNFNGDQWRNNEGWLDPEVTPCDWFGVFCSMVDGQLRLLSLSLPDNNLRGPLDDTNIFDHVTWRVLLNGNRIHGSLTELPLGVDTVDLGDNRLTGTLPPGPDTLTDSLEVLNLARNRIGGEVPESWSRLAMRRLDLSNNRLEGSVEPALSVDRTQSCTFVNVADNEFSGEVLSGVIRPNLCRHNDSGGAGGINLCWNDVSAGGLDRWLGQHHVGGADFDACLGRERLALGPEISGSWLEPERAGEGVAVQLLDDGRAAMFVFGFDNQGRQHWLTALGTALDKTLHWRRLLAERGTFGEGAVDQPVPPVNQVPRMGVGRDWRMDRVDAQGFHIERTYLDFSHCSDNTSYLCFTDPVSDRFDYTQLSRLAGTTCDNQQPGQWISGAWYDPARAGEGFVVEVLSQARAAVYWFTFRPDDSRHQAWMLGTGELDGHTLQIDNLVQPQGGRWGDDFDPASIELTHWGSLTLEFTDQDSGRVSWNSVKEGFGSGEHPIARLTAPRLAECGSS